MSPVRPVGLGLAVVACLSVAGRVHAQEGGGDGFLFRPPHGEVSIRGGYNHAAAGSDHHEQERPPDFAEQPPVLQPRIVELDVAHSLGVRPRLDPGEERLTSARS